MGFVGGELGYRILRRLAPGGGRSRMDGSAYRGRSKLEVLLGREALESVRGRTVLDFGCGAGGEAIELAQRGARRVIGLDIQEHLLAQARERAEAEGVADRCAFVTETDERVDAIVCIDAFEHFADPAGILLRMRELLADDGAILASFGPTWYHPLGGHLFSVFPWAHLVFTEDALLRWRSDFKTDGARRFGEVAGGLNCMTIARFERLVEESPFRCTALEAVPIRRLARVSNRLTREFTTAIVRCRLEPRAATAPRRITSAAGAYGSTTTPRTMEATES